MATMKDVHTTDFYVNMDKVMSVFLKGETNYTRIARKTGLPRADVMRYIEEWRATAPSNTDIKLRAKNNLAEMDEHYSMLISRAWETVEQADDSGDIKTKVTAIKAIADIEAKRQDTLQKAGMYDDAEIGDQLAQMAEQSEAIKQMLVDIAEKYPQAKSDILDGLRRIFGGGQASVPDMPVLKQ